MDFDLVALFQFEGVDYSGGKTDRQTVTPFRAPRRFLPRYTAPNRFLYSPPPPESDMLYVSDGRPTFTDDLWILSGIAPRGNGTKASAGCLSSLPLFCSTVLRSSL